MSTINVALGHDIGRPESLPGLDRLGAAERSRLRFLALGDAGTVRASELGETDILITTPGVAAITAESLPAGGRLVAILRTGVGYNEVDTDAVTAADAALVIPPDTVRRPTAAATLTLILATTTWLVRKHAITQEGPRRWSELAGLKGLALTGKTVGIVGLGNVGADLAKLLRPLEPVLIGHDPFVDPKVAAELGVELVELDDLMRRSDVVSLNLILSAGTRHIIDARRLALMKPTAFLINAARGPVVDQKALTEALAARRIAGAGLDVLDDEPPRADDPILKLDNVTLSGHALNWNDEYTANLERDMAAMVTALLHGKVPHRVANARVLERPGFKQKLAALAALGGRS
ncbi:MAG: NAD(P)-dependent oxidoreductase [Alphaproteobacteria bacterium]